jgi:hypothetical protein
MATEAARLKNQEPTGRKKKNRLDSYRPSHGRTYAAAREATRISQPIPTRRSSNAILMLTRMRLPSSMWREG